MRVSVDRALCEANGICVGILPDVFDLDDDEVLQIRQRELTEDEVGPAREAVLSCPKGALRVD